MSTLTFPTLSAAPAVCRFSLVPNTQVFESPLNRTVQTLELPGARWAFYIEYRSISQADARIVKVFLAQLRGRAGRFCCHDFAHPTPSGSALGTPAVVGASQTGTILLTDGWTASQSALLQPGDYFSVNGELKLVAAVCSSDGSGNATLTFEPPLRHSPADNVAITVLRPSATFMLKDDEQDSIPIDPDRRPTLTIEGVEVFA